MCESSAYLRNDKDEDELLLEDVIMMRPQGDKIILTSILGDRQELRAEVDHIDLLHHRIILRQRP